MKKRLILPAVIALNAAFALGANFLVVDVVKTQAAVKRTQEPSNGSINFSTFTKNGSSSITWTSDHLSITQTKGTGSSFNVNYDDEPRWYTNNTIEFTAAEDITISSMTFTWSRGNPTADSFNAGTYNPDNNTWTGTLTGSPALKLTPKEQMRPTAISYTYISTAADKNTVTFNLNGGTGTESAQVVTGTALAQPETEPYKANQKFTGWYTDEGCTQAYNFSSTVSSDFTLYAGWRDFTDSDIVGINTIATNYSYRIQGEVIAQYNSKGYVIQDNTAAILVYADESSTISGLAIGNTIKVTGQYKTVSDIPELVITADKANISVVDSTDTSLDTTPLTTTGDVVGANNYKYTELTRLQLGEDFSYSNNSIPLSNVENMVLVTPAQSFITRDQESYSSGTYVDVKGFVFITNNVNKLFVSDISLSTRYTVTYHSNGGTAVAPETVFAGETFTEPTNPTKPDDASYKYVFDCWCTDEQLTNAYNFATASSSNLDLYAKYTQTEITAADYITNLNTKSQLSYDFSVNTDKVDTLNKDLTDVSGTSYTTKTGKTSVTDAVYSFRCAGGNSSVQLRSTDNSGIVTTTSGGHAKRISVTWESHTANGRTLNVYGSNTAYSAPANLYGDDKGTLLGTIVKNASTELLIDGDYEYIGLRSDDGAMYLDEVKIYWDCTEEMTISDAKLHFGGLVEKSALEDSSVAASEVGVFVARTSKLNGNAIKDVYTDPTYSSLILSSSIAYANVQATDATGTATSGDYAIWQAALSIPSTKFKESITAVAWAKSSTGNYTFFAERSFSVVTLAEAYQADTDVYNRLTDNQKASIDYLAALND